MQQSESDIHALTAMRGLAAYWVVLFHFSDTLFAVLPEAVAVAPLVHAGFSAVPLFFILSGYLLGSRYTSNLTSSRALTRYVWLRLGRIYPVHLASLALVFLLVTRNGWPSEPHYSPETLVANLLMVHAWQPTLALSWNSPSWSISSEWFAYLIFPVLVAVFRRRSPSTMISVVVGFAAVAAWCHAYRDQVPFQGLAVTVPAFIGGVGLGILRRPESGTVWDARIAVACFVAAAALPFLTSVESLRSAGYIVLFFAMVRCVGAAGNKGPAWWRQRWMLRCGEISYSLYMTHSIAFSFIGSAVLFLGVSTQPVPVRIAFIGAALSFVTGAAMLMHYIVERPAREYSRSAGVGRTTGLQRLSVISRPTSS